MILDRIGGAAAAEGWLGQGRWEVAVGMEASTRRGTWAQRARLRAWGDGQRFAKALKFSSSFLTVMEVGPGWGDFLLR